MSTTALRGTGTQVNYSLGFTGERGRRHFQVRIGDSAVDLTRSTLQALIQLLLARAEAGSGFVRLSEVIVCRLRHAFDDALREGRGEALIETGCTREYRLTSMPACVLVEPAFFELEALGVLSADQAAGLRRLAESTVKSR
jgi:hypothetical protein